MTTVCAVLAGGRAMKVEFAPLNIPLARRLQTAAVFQWVLTFLLLGKNPACSRRPRSRQNTAVQRTPTPPSPTVLVQGRASNPYSPVS